MEPSLFKLSGLHSAAQKPRGEDRLNLKDVGPFDIYTKRPRGLLPELSAVIPCKSGDTALLLSGLHSGLLPPCGA